MDLRLGTKSRDLTHANHAIYDVKSGLLRGTDARKTKDSGGTVYLGVKCGNDSV